MTESIPEQDPLDNAQLIQAAIAADGAEREALFDSVMNRVAALFRRRIPPKMAAIFDPEGLASETAAKLNDQLNEGGVQFLSTPAFKGYVDAIAENRLRDAIRCSQAQRRGGRWSQVVAGTESTVNLLQQLGVDDLTASRVAIREEMIVQVADIIASLKPEEEQLVKLRFEHQLTNAEVASLLDLSESAVNSRYFRLFQKLGQEFRAHPDFSSFW